MIAALAWDLLRFLGSFAGIFACGYILYHLGRGDLPGILRRETTANPHAFRCPCCPTWFYGLTRKRARRKLERHIAWHKCGCTCPDPEMALRSGHVSSCELWRGTQRRSTR